MEHSEQVRQQLFQLYKKHFNEEPKTIFPIAASGSDRKYFRLEGNNHAVVGAYNTDVSENSAFFYFTDFFRNKKINVPEIIAKSGNKQYYLLQDLGDQSLFGLMAQEGHSDRVLEYFKKSISALADLHWNAARDLDYSMCYASRVFDKQQIFADLLYFKYYFLDLQKIAYNKQELMQELEEWSGRLASFRPQTFMYRDFQSRNIQIVGDEVYFIDYQGGMLGMPQYDIASLLWQARAQLPDSWKSELLTHYFTAIETQKLKPGINEVEFRKQYLEIVLLRMLQTLGAYGFRGLIERKPHFITSIAPALKQLAAYLDMYPSVPFGKEIRKVLEKMVQPESIGSFINFEKPADAPLHVSVYSFSFKKGLPADISGNGGGFVFDCRGLLNPGRIEEYKTQTGKDRAVKEYLETKTKMTSFLQNVFDVVDISVEDYLQRGFAHLMVAFGCTGGQHRSVYAAEAMVKHLKEKYSLDASIVHLEQEPNLVSRLAIRE